MTFNAYVDYHYAERHYTSVMHDENCYAECHHTGTCLANNRALHIALSWIC
jgi:hypothetical protein